MEIVLQVKTHCTDKTHLGRVRWGDLTGCQEAPALFSPRLLSAQLGGKSLLFSPIWVFFILSHIQERKENN